MQRSFWTLSVSYGGGTYGADATVNTEQQLGQILVKGQGHEVTELARVIIQ